MVRWVCRARAASHGRAPAKLAQRNRLKSSWALLCASHASTRLGSLRTFSRTSPSARVSLTRCSIRRVVHMQLFAAFALHATLSFFAHVPPAVFMFSSICPYLSCVSASAPKQAVDGTAPSGPAVPPMGGAKQVVIPDIVPPGEPMAVPKVDVAVFDEDEIPF